MILNDTSILQAIDSEIHYPSNSNTVDCKLSVSIGICTFNEEANIENHLKSLLAQQTNMIDIDQIVVVSSACSDRTDQIVAEYHEIDSRIQLIKQSERKGKASAVNLFLRAARGHVCVLVSADTILLDDTVERLCLPFLLDDGIGIVGGHPIPVNDPNKFMGFVSHYIWHLAHSISLRHPKVGEMIAFKNIVRHIPDKTAVDEASIEAIVSASGYLIEYVPDAVVLNRGPETVSDFIRQRRRIHAGHLHLRKHNGYTVSSMNSFKLGQLVLKSITPSWKSTFWTLCAVALEGYSRFLGAYDFYARKRNPYIWEMVSSTKLLQDDA